ncbi:CYTH domain-containing protein [Streptomyces sp. NBC_01298]|uniref:CYTH domain-containing protein n=1 Tax=Streptomyces sp. NBC_01298 TaxID=2903817 RepID=UPI002E0E400D|nr:CYTH domain-containing protein [Streptomyces sp. NBC_01298]
MTYEIERKFLVHGFVPPAGARAQNVRQGYVAITGEGTEVRVRRADGRHTLTVKSGLGLTRVEVEREIEAADFDALWPTTVAARVEKDRYRMADGPHTLVVDVYHGALHGLCTAEVEFASAEEARQYTPPAWVGEEATGLVGYLNQSLATHGIPARQESTRKDHHGH